MKKLFTEKEILELNSKGIKTVTISKGDIITPSAMDKIRELNFSIVEGVKADTIDTIYRKAGIKKQGIEKIIAIGSDHTGFTMKGKVSSYLIDKGYKVIDVGTNDESSCDYPDFALAVAEKVKSEEAGFGIILDATGIPSAITANKVPGIRAATCYNEFSARSAREHNDANILVMGAKTLGEATITSIIDVFFSASFLGDRHQRRLNKITSIEEKYSK